MGDRGPTERRSTTLRIAGNSHRISVVGVEGAMLRVDGDAHVEHTERGAVVDSPGGRLTVTVPAGSDVAIGGTSGRISVSGPLGHVAVVSVSGRVEVEQATSVDIRTETSRVEIGSVTGTCRVRSVSGRVDVSECGGADVASRSGRVGLHHVDGQVDAHSVSGRIEVSLDRAHDVRAETVSGTIEVSLPRGANAFRPDGPTDQRLPPPGSACTVSARSQTGKVIVAAR